MVLISRWCLRTISGLSTLANVAKHPVYFQSRADLAGDRHTQVAVATDVRSRLQAVVTWSSADHTFVAGQPVRRRRAPLTGGLNRNHNRVLKDVFKGAATAAAARPGPLQDFYNELVARGLREEMARLTLARKIAALTLRLWKTGEYYDPTQLTRQPS